MIEEGVREGSTRSGSLMFFSFFPSVWGLKELLEDEADEEEDEQGRSQVFRGPKLI